MLFAIVFILTITAIAFEITWKEEYIKPPEHYPRKKMITCEPMPDTITWKDGSRTPITIRACSFEDGIIIEN